MAHSDGRSGVALTISKRISVGSPSKGSPDQRTAGAEVILALYLMNDAGMNVLSGGG